MKNEYLNKAIPYENIQEIRGSVFITNIQDKKFDDLIQILNTLPHVHHTIPLSGYLKAHSKEALFKDFRKNISTETFSSVKDLAEILSRTYYGYSKGAIQFKKDSVNKNKLVFIIKNPNDKRIHTNVANQDIKDECDIVLEVLLPLLKDYFKLEDSSFQVEIERSVIKKELSTSIINIDKTFEPKIKSKNNKLKL